MQQTYDTKQIISWSAVILAIVALFVGLVYLAGGNQPATILAAPVDESTDRIKGPIAAKVTLIEYSDFECPACAQYESLVDQVISTYPNDLRFVYRHYPLVQIHRSALPAAQAAEAANKQGKFWEMHNILFDRQDSWSQATTSVQDIFTGYASELGLNTDQFVEDMTSDDVSSKISNDMNSGNASGVTGTPTFYLNGKKIIVRSLEELKALIQAEIDAAA